MIAITVTVVLLAGLMAVAAVAAIGVCVVMIVHSVWNELLKDLFL